MFQPVSTKYIKTDQIIYIIYIYQTAVSTMAWRILHK